MIYLAGPFFNERQLARIQRIENICKQYAIPHYSPRRDAGILKPKSSIIERQEVYEANADALFNCDCILAVTNYELPCDCKVHVTYLGSPLVVGDKALELFLPDTGTVWEMGFATALKKPIVIFHDNPASKKLNVMLTQSCNGFLNTYEELDEFLRCWANCVLPISSQEDVERFFADDATFTLKSWKGEIE